MLSRPTNKSARHDIAWPQDRLRQVGEAYAADFGRFGYNPDALPAGARMSAAASRNAA